MPQLDIIILLPQVFSLFFFFILFYIILTYTLLPKFLVALKLRRSASELNQNNSTVSISNSTNLPKQNLHKNLRQLHQNFQLTHAIFKKNLTTVPLVFDIQLSSMITQSFLFSDTASLQNIKLRVKGLSSKS